MKDYNCSVVVVGGGPAGLAAAISAKKNGAEKVIVIERENRLGGILKQCIHAGFGLQYFGEELTGPEYAEKFAVIAKENGIEFMLNTTALEIKEKTLVCVNTDGIINIHFGALVLAMGCRERTRANLVIPGSRPSGIYTAGTAQKLINIYGHKVGKEVVILGSGDIGMIMARRLSLNGAKVKAVIEIMPYLAGLVRNKLQCLDDFDIPLMLSHTIVDITGVDRVESVTVAPVDENRQPIMEKAETITCDTLLLSVGLIPENELTRSANVELSCITKGAVVNQYKQTDKPYIFACGNVLHVNDLVDHVSHESEDAGKFAALYAAGKLNADEEIAVTAGDGVRYVCPQKMVRTEDNVDLYFRTTAPGRNTTLTISDDNGVLVTKKLVRTTPGTIEKLTLTGDKAKNVCGKLVVSAEHKEA
ncbi:MAG: FAD-dependent oxidoreductase [Ruminococcaceae bacterium]|nr:FAD-dependent oxidoreductase [Oscillospiraceae bacterium]